MKKLLLSMLFFAGTYMAQAQTICTPDQNMKEVGMQPRNLPDAKAGLAYSEVIQFKFPKDTINPITQERTGIDSVVITNVEGFPSGFSYQCNKNNRCSYLGGDNGCVVIKGNPTADMMKHYTIKVSAKAYVQFGGASVPFAFSDTVSLDVVSTTGFFTQNKTDFGKFELRQNQPNPFSRNTKIVFNSPNAQKTTFKVFDILGNTVYTKDLSANRGENSFIFERNNLKNGIYFYSLRFGNQLLTKKFTIKN